VLKSFDRALGASKKRRNLAITHIGKEAKCQHLLLIFGKLLNRLLERHPIGDRACVILAMLINKIVLEFKRRKDKPPPTLVATQDVCGNRVEPAKEGFVVAILKTGDPVDDLDENLLG